MKNQKNLFDDLLAEKIDRFFSKYRDNMAFGGPETISRTQFSALSSAAFTGPKHLKELVRDRVERNERNERAREEKKGSKKAKDPVFWTTLKTWILNDLANMPKDICSQHQAFREGINRLAIEWNYRNTLNK